MIAHAKKRKPRQPRIGVAYVDSRGGERSLVLELAFMPKAKKNRPRLVDIGDRTIMATSDASRTDQAAMKRMLAAAIDEGRVLWPDDDLEATFTLHMRSERCSVRVRSIGPRPKGFTGRRRDIANVPEAVLDAMQGSVMGNDNQVATLIVRRTLE